MRKPHVWQHAACGDVAIQVAVVLWGFLLLGDASVGEGHVAQRASTHDVAWRAGLLVTGG